MDKPTPSEYSLALRARDGDREAVAELAARMRARLFALAYAELRHYEDAHDALAAALLQICCHVGELREPERVVAWMQSIVRNEARRLRRAGPEPAGTLFLAEADGPAGGNDEDLLLRLDIERALGRIPARQAAALRQFYLAEMPVQAIAAGMGASEGAVKMWLHRGRRRLRAEMEGYEPMATTEKQKPLTRAAAILHSDLEPELRQRAAAALRKGGYMARFLTPGDLGEPGSTEPGPWDVLKGCDALVLVEPFGERSVFEYILLLQASWETAQIPVAVVTKTMRPDPLRALAFHTLGVAGLAARDAPESLDYLFRWTGGGGRSRDAAAVILFADDEARRAGQDAIGAEHLLLGLLRDEGTARLLRERLNVSPEQVAGAVRQRMERRPEYERHPWRHLTEQGRAALQRAREEAGDGATVETGHLLLGLAQDADTVAGQVLAERGLTPERIRAALQA